MKILILLITLITAQISDPCSNPARNKCLPSACTNIISGGLTFPICCVSGYLAVNNTCVTCETLYETSVEDPSKQNQFPFLQKYYSQISNLNYTKCFGSCENGQRVSSVNTSLETCKNIPLRVNNCSYACQDISYLNSATSALSGLEIEFNRGNFLEDLMEKIYATTGDVIAYPDHLEIHQNSSATNLQDFITDLTLEITPNIPNLIINISNGTIFIYSSDNITTLEIRSENTLAVIVSTTIGGLVGFIALLGLLYGYYRFNQTNLSVLPPNVEFIFKQYENIFETGWKYRGSSDTGYYYKKLKGNQLDEVMKLPEVAFGVQNGLKFTSCTAVYNKALIKNFINTYLIQKERAKSSTALFNKKKWELNSELSKHQNVYNHFLKHVSNNNVPILGCYHGTDGVVAEKICETNFAKLSLLDSGFFSAGIYFTSYPRYCLPYIVNKREPVIIFSWVLVGNPYPVIESHEKPNSLMGKPIKNGYSSHYVMTNQKGYSITDATTETEVFNEIVIPQEAQIVPALIFTYDQGNL